MDFRILGPLEVLANGRPLALGGAKPRAVLAVLLLHVNETVSVDSLIDALWGESAPNGAVQSVRVHISRLRKVLENGRAEGDPPSVLVTTSGGYELRVGDGNLDLSRFEGLFAEGQRALAEERPERAAELLSEALALWRGPALADLAFEPFAQAEAGRLDELRVAALEDRIEADLALGRQAAVASELEPLIAAHPLRERLRRLQMLALYRSGRQAEALEAYRSARRTLVDEIGVEPGTELRELHDAILRQDPALEAPVAAAEPPATPPAAVEPPGPEPPPAAERRRTVPALLVLAGIAVAAALVAVGVLSGRRRGRRDDRGELGRRAGPRKRRAAIARSRSAAGPDRRPQTPSRSGWPTRSTTRCRGSMPSRVRWRRSTSAASPRASRRERGSPGLPTRPRARSISSMPGANRIVGSLEVGNGPRGVAVAFGARLGAGGGRRRGRASRPRRRRGDRADSRWARGRPRSRPAPARYGSPTKRPGPWSAWSRTRAGCRRRSASATAPAASHSAKGQYGSPTASTARFPESIPKPNAVTSTVEVGAAPSAVKVGEGGIWVANAGDGMVLRLAPDTADVEETIDVGGSPSGLTVASGAVWASVLASTESHRGGALVAAMSAGDLFCDCVDPASYDIGNTTVASLAYDGLTAYRRVGGTAGSTLVANLATDDPGTGGRRAHLRLRAAARPPVLGRHRGRPRGLPQLDRADAAVERADVVRRLTTSSRA